jgi:hypothetical protein
VIHDSDGVLIRSVFYGVCVCCGRDYPGFAGAQRIDGVTS